MNPYQAPTAELTQIPEATTNYKRLTIILLAASSIGFLACVDYVWVLYYLTKIYLTLWVNA